MDEERRANEGGWRGGAGRRTGRLVSTQTEIAVNTDSLLQLLLQEINLLSHGGKTAVGGGV